MAKQPNKTPRISVNKLAEFITAKAVRNFGIWISGVLASGIVGGMAAVATFQAVAIFTPTMSGALLTALLGFAAGALAFTCFRLWLAEPR